MGVLRYNFNSKLNKKPPTGYCLNCLEDAVFRATYDKVEEKYKSPTTYNALTCTRCLSTARYNKKGIKKSTFSNISFKNKLTVEDKVRRFFLRFYKFLFLGTWNRKRFDLRLLRGL